MRWTYILLAVLSGTLTSLAFPKFSLSFLGWISLIPLFFVLINKTSKQSFFLGLIAGITFNAILIYWIPAVPAHYGNLSLGMSILIYIVFVLYLALFWAFFCWCFAKIHRIFPQSVYFLAPFLWIALEYILTHLLTGFPWGLLGNTQYRNLWFLQLACLTGIYGLSFVLVFFQSLFVFSLRYGRKIPFIFAVILVVLIHLGGWLRIKTSSLPTETFGASVIQGNMSSDIYWHRISEQHQWSLFERHMDLSTEAFYKDAELIVWPEFTVPLCFSCPSGIYPEFKARLIAFAQNTGCTLLVGTNERTFSRSETHYYNTALCLHPDLTMSHYYKMHLVPFGEYTPYQKVFFFIEKLTHAVGDITPGKTYTLHQYQGKKFGSPICYEIIFPDLVRKFVKKGANFLVTITNDGWYGTSSAPFQHFSMAVIRAVENRRYLLRAATTGISGIIDPYGRILARSEMMTQSVFTEEIAPLEKLTFYSRYGDVLPYMSLTLSVLFLILAIGSRKNDRKKLHLQTKPFGASNENQTGPPSIRRA